MRILGQAFWKRREFWTTLLPLFVRRQAVRSIQAMQQPVSTRIRRLLSRVYGRLASMHRATQAIALARRFKQLGAGSQLPELSYISHPEHIAIGRNLRANPGLIITTHVMHGGESYSPSVTLGDFVQLGANCLLDCCISIHIGDWVLIGNQVSIWDNELDASAEEMAKPPVNRRLLSKGPVSIGANVLIEDRVCILPGVSIGENTIVKAGALVCDPVPANVVVAGSPARIVARQSSIVDTAT